MITYKEFEVIRTLLRAEETPENIANYVYSNKHYYVFKSEDEVAELAASLEKKGYLKDGKVTESAMEELEPLRSTTLSFLQPVVPTFLPNLYTTCLRACS